MIAGGALAGIVGGPLGARLGGVLASQASRVFGLELSPRGGEIRGGARFVRCKENSCFSYTPPFVSIASGA